jgi:hypothetical protein
MTMALFRTVTHDRIVDHDVEYFAMAWIWPKDFWKSEPSRTRSFEKVIVINRDSLILKMLHQSALFCCRLYAEDVFSDVAILMLYRGNERTLKNSGRLADTPPSNISFCLKMRVDRFKFIIMSEETKTADGDYVMMGGESAGGVKLPGLDDPNLSQEDRDHRMAISLQQQENAAAYDSHKNKHDQLVKANTNRTARSGTFTRLAAVRDKDQGMLSVPADYTTENAYVKSSGEYLPPIGKTDEEILRGATPQQIADFKVAKELQKVEQVGAGTAREMSKIESGDKGEEDAQIHRTGYSNYHKP